MKPRIIVDDNIPYIRGRLEAVADVVYTDQHGFTPELVKDADALVIRTRTQCNEKLLKGSKVRLIATATIGMDQIDRDYCERRGITVRNSPGCNAPGVAQYVWSGLLREGFDPQRDTLGIVGCGNVGTIVKEWGEKLGARVLVNDPPKASTGELTDTVDLETLLRESDAVTLHTPLTKKGDWPTYHLLGEKELGLLKKGGILVNAARGPVVSQEALKNQVREGRFRLIIDTWEYEPETDKELLAQARYATFHIAGYSRQGKERATRMVLEAVGEEFGLPVDVTGLAENYRPLESVTAEGIKASYDPGTDTEALRSAPESFDTLRRDYNYREEY